MTDREKAIVTAYTGYAMLAGDKLDVYYEYVQEKLGRSVMTHELAYQEVQDAIQEAAKEDFIAIAKAGNGWISVQDRLPDNGQDVLVYLNDGEETRVAPCNYANGVWFDCVMNRVVTLHHITHWMPLPEPPKEEA